MNTDNKAKKKDIYESHFSEFIKETYQLLVGKGQDEMFEFIEFHPYYQISWRIDETTNTPAASEVGNWTDQKAVMYALLKMLKEYAEKELPKLLSELPNTQGGKVARWVKASERLPETDSAFKKYIVRYINLPDEVYTWTLNSMRMYNDTGYVIEWLEEIDQTPAQPTAIGEWREELDLIIFDAISTNNTVGISNDYLKGLCEGVADLIRDHFQSLIHPLQQENEQYRKDIEDAAGELMVKIPEPGTDLAKVLHANIMMRKYKIPELQSQLTQLRQENEKLQTELNNLKK